MKNRFFYLFQSRSFFKEVSGIPLINKTCGRHQREWRQAESLLLILVTLWAGALWTVGFVVAPALFKLIPDRAMAGWGRRFRLALKGVDPRTGRPFLWHLFQARPGGGAFSAGDGWPAAGEWQAAGGIKFGSLEVHEVRFPLFFLRHELRPDSGGDGRYRGGPGAILEMRIEVGEPALANTAGDGVRHGARGILGGRDGLPHDYRRVSPDGGERILKTKEVGIVIRPGDVLLARSGGGGGYGDPAERDPHAGERDREEGYVSGGEDRP